MSSKGRVSATLKQANTPQKLPSAKTSQDNYKLTGKFKDDFENICSMKQIRYVPEVTSKYKRPSSSNPNAQQADSNKDKQTKASIAKITKQINDKENVFKEGEDAEGSDEPKSFIIRDSYEYFKPKIYCEMDNPEKWETVNEIHVKGWKLEKPILEILQLCLPRVTHLNTLNLWNSGLDENSVRTIAALLPDCHNLKTLILDSNPIATPVYQALFYVDNSHVQNLSLRNNQLGDDAIQEISFGLGDIRRQNTKIINLNLNNNKIGNAGAISLARALRTNRTLLTLSLSNNFIEDEGAQAFAYVLSRFPLTHEEIVHRRKVKSNVNYDENALPPSRRGNADSKERPPSQKSQLQGASLNRDKKSATKKDNLPGGGASTAAGANKNAKDTAAKAKKDEKPAGPQRRDAKGKDSLSTVDAKSVKQLKTGTITKNLSAKTAEKDDKKVDKALLEISALTDVAENINDELWLAGNRNLLSLNLSRNKLTIKSIDSFILALQYQKTLTELYKGIGQGLLRLVVNLNEFKIDHESYLKLNDILKTCDPFYKTPNQEQDISDKASVHSGGKESSFGKTNKNKH